MHLGGRRCALPPNPPPAFFLGLPPLQGQPTPTWNVSTSNWNHRKKINSQNNKKINSQNISAPLFFLVQDFSHRDVTRLDPSFVLPVMPGQAWGGSFQKEKNYIAKKEFAYRMCARQRAFCRSMVVLSCALKWSVLMSSCLLQRQVMWWSPHLMWCDGLCCVMSRDAMPCHGDELYHSSTTKY